VNVSQRLALGGSLITIWDTSAARAGAKLRARWWLNPKLSVDVSPGLILWDHRFEADPPGFAAYVGLNYADWIAATGQVESIKGVGGGRYVGLKAGSYAGLIVFVVSAIGAGIGLLAYAAAG
jgi:hypothetical protein